MKIMYDMKLIPAKGMGGTKEEHEVSTAQGAVFSFRKSAGEEQGQMGRRDHAGGHATLPVGQTRAGRSGKVYRVDALARQLSSI